MGLHWNDLPGAIVEQVRRGVVIPAHPLALTEARALDERRPAGARALLYRRRQRRARGWRPHHPVRDPRGRIVRAGAETRRRHHGRLDRPAADRRRRTGRPHRPGGPRGGNRSRSRLPCGPAQPRRPVERKRGRAGRALRPSGRRDPACRLLSSARRRRTGPAGLVLETLRRDRQRHRRQGRALQPLPDPRHHPRRGSRRAPRTG